MVWYRHQELVENATTLNDNGSANSVDTVHKFFGVERWQVLQCPPCSSDLSPSNCNQILKLKQPLQGKQYANIQDILTAFWCEMAQMNMLGWRWCFLPFLRLAMYSYKHQCSATVCLPQFIVGNQILYSWEFLFTDFHGHWVSVVVYYGLTVVGIGPLHVHSVCQIIIPKMITMHAVCLPPTSSYCNYTPSGW